MTTTGLAPAGAAPTLSFSPATGSAGTVITFSGAGCAPNPDPSVPDLTFGVASGPGRAQPYDANPNATFGGTYTVPTESNPADGPTYPVFVFCTSTSESVESGTFTYARNPSVALAGSPGFDVTLPATVTFAAITSGFSPPADIFVFDVSPDFSIRTGEPLVTVEYSRPATYTIRVTASNSAGQSATTTRTLTLSPSGAKPTPLVAFHYPSATLPLDIVADAFNSIGGAGDPITSYSFDWGDGSVDGPTSRPYSEHTYSKRDKYEVTVTVRTESGVSASTTQAVLVRTAAARRFAEDLPSPGSPGTTISSSSRSSQLGAAAVFPSCAVRYDGGSDLFSTPRSCNWDLRRYSGGISALNCQAGSLNALFTRTAVARTRKVDYLRHSMFREELVVGASGASWWRRVSDIARSNTQHFGDGYKGTLRFFQPWTFGPATAVQRLRFRWEAMNDRFLGVDEPIYYWERSVCGAA
jgi:PKD repeat protein